MEVYQVTLWSLEKKNKVPTCPDCGAKCPTRRKTNARCKKCATKREKDMKVRRLFEAALARTR